MMMFGWSSPVAPECPSESTKEETELEEFLSGCIHNAHCMVRRLDDVLTSPIPLHGRGNFPTLNVRLRDLVTVVKKNLEAEVGVANIRLNGGAASHVLAAEENQPYNDLDLIFAVDLSSPKNFESIKNSVLESLLDFLPANARKDRLSCAAVKEAYVHKMVKVNETDRWSLISLSNGAGKNVELKFVDRMRRNFEFSVDSFQIILDSLLVFHKCSKVPMTENFYPTVVAESCYGDFAEALHHLHAKLIATRNPEEIRGGGLLKYCNLLVKGYRASQPQEIRHLERYMCSRFFIDFPDIYQQQIKLQRYLANHLGDESPYLQHEFLMVLHRVVASSTVCLMGHERRQSLSLIDSLACQILSRSTSPSDPHPPGKQHHPSFMGWIVYPVGPYHQQYSHPHLNALATPWENLPAHHAVEAEAAA
ncbi:unnamed protein product [Cyprideis torosa]|uniref:polynucleotide adenylyltransferase n=1 Tax=Cyprideis torosa TaxID=163714 RepID=A0A7R8ZM90_9CRUS|nr:unnamed protein product [Cyprideis torosa]CAG0883819.1 unnamed protein product [Cyprideis torosa]